MKNLILFVMTLISMLGISAQSLCIDPGHGGSDPGAVGCGLKEAAINLDVANRFCTLMKNAGYKVYMTRTSDATVSLSSRTQYANNLGVARFVSIHCNAYNGSAHGTETFCYPSGSSTSFALRNNTNPQIVSALGTYNRGCKTANFHVLRETNMPAILAELAFIDNSSDAAKLGNPTYRQKAAQALKNGYVNTREEDRGIVVEEKTAYYVNPRFSEDGSQIYVKKAGDQNLYSVPLMGGNLAQAFVAESSDQRDVYAYVQDEDIFTSVQGQVYQITHHEDTFFHPILSPNQQWVVFQGLVTGLYIADVQGTKVFHIGPGNNACFTPDSKAIVFDVSTDNGEEIITSEIHLVQLSDLKNHEILTPKTLKAQRPHVSTNGTEIVFDSEGKIYVTNLTERGMICMEVEIVE